MAALPQGAQIALAGKVSAAIYDQREKTQEDGRRPHLGASIIGRECARQIWYSFRWARNTKHGGRLLLLFETGHKAEERFVEGLRSIGAEVVDKLEDGLQIRFATLGGHFAGSLDGMARGTPYAPKTWAVTEYKTHSHKSFTKLKAEGVKLAKPEHYAQMQVYMERVGVDRALYLAKDKDTDELHDEWIHLDKAFAQAMLARAERIIKADAPPAGISTDASFFKCKFCDYNSICHGTSVPDVTCRSCAHSSPVIDDSTSAAWRCEKWGANIPGVAEQRQACSGHRYIPILLAATASPVDYHNGDVIYECKKTGKQFANGEGVAAFSSTEIATAESPAVLGELAEVKGMWPSAKVVA